MLLKSQTLKHPAGIGNLVRYIFKEQSRYTDKKGKEFIHAHNIEKSDIDGYIQQFKENLKALEQSRSRVQMYHYLLSWNPDDKEKLNTTILRQSTRKFISLLNDKGQFLSVAHGKDTGHVHIHILAAGLELGRNKALRVNKQHFSDIQQTLQDYEKFHFPFLNSTVNYGKKEKERTQLPHTEYEMGRYKRTSKKHKLRNDIQKTAQQAESKAAFLQLLQDQNIHAYYRNSKLAGFKDPTSGRKYRIKTLQLEETLKRVDKSTEKNKQQKNDIDPSTIKHEPQEKIVDKSTAPAREQDQPQYQEVMGDIQQARTIAREREQAEQSQEHARGGRQPQGREQEQDQGR